MRQCLMAGEVIDDSSALSMQCTHNSDPPYPDMDRRLRVRSTITAISHVCRMERRVTACVVELYIPVCDTAYLAIRGMKEDIYAANSE